MYHVHVHLCEFDNKLPTGSSSCDVVSPASSRLHQHDLHHKPTTSASCFADNNSFLSEGATLGQNTVVTSSSTSFTNITCTSGVLDSLPLMTEDAIGSKALTNKSKTQSPLLISGISPITGSIMLVSNVSAPDKTQSESGQNESIKLGLGWKSTTSVHKLLDRGESEKSE
ncbi:unnamed protein product [Protopolystoma xenopodis]|uniref:Uncharacterized protein n=1 Tax=Protopolystoma xenopodis TaxID=117903 RepID=A0A448W9Y4_9PLAT|nr:unnamed protein product [Protopolystoma xenopodis]